MLFQSRGSKEISEFINEKKESASSLRRGWRYAEKEGKVQGWKG